MQDSTMSSCAQFLLFAFSALNLISRFCMARFGIIRSFDSGARLVPHSPISCAISFQFAQHHPPSLPDPLRLRHRPDPTSRELWSSTPTLLQTVFAEGVSANRRRKGLTLKSN